MQTANKPHMILVGSANRSPKVSSFSSFLECLHLYYVITFTLEIRMRQLSVTVESAMSIYYKTWKFFEDFEETHHKIMMILYLL